MDAFSGAVAGLPMYVLMKANASLYNTINVTLGETTELFRLSYNSCKQIENELRQNPDSNPYQGFIRASILDKWHFGMENDENIADTDQRIKEDPVDPILWFGGNRAGTVENPIQINRDLVIAGYNIMIGRTGDVSVVTAPTGAAAEQPIVRIWPNPAEAGRWIQEVIGDQILILENPPPHPETIPGKGLRPIVTALEPEIHEALMEVFSHNNYDLMNNYLSLPSISGKLADGLRTLPRHEVLVFMDRLVSEMAVKEVQERLFLIRQMIYTALKAPDLLATPEAGREAQNYAQDKTFPGIRDTLEEVFNDLELRQRTLNPTMLTIFDRAEAFRKSGQSKQSVSTHREQRVE
jgi:integrating conjugative element protein (TIGR03755 family)